MFERNNDLERKQLAPGVYITTLDAAKFNRCRITLHLRFPARRESATDAAVLALLAGKLGYDPDVRCTHHDEAHGEGGHTCGSHGCGNHSCH